ncbi:DUF547 domain-containing protein [Desulfovibrio ferrophilus]|uniref:DUF547 domain-containing protein n=1 Tax=Desulfovibrio ferrophilus TaxID=241368 RepID=A0A2Z6AX96_9BACT|nr:DUF547 domain-containing protein [Desulfovibrio ferrophilus]BBD07882.1 uncharacterized protein DFE_1156 [Desulfovibrio ferrophilus]
MRGIFVFIVLALMMGGAGGAEAQHPPLVDNTIYAALLDANVSPTGEVDYRALKIREAELDAYLDVLRGINPQSLGQDERFAYWINVYNAFTLKLILSEYPGVESIRDLGGLFSSPWKRKFIVIGGQELHLDNVEKDILIPEFKDPRVHFAINCASKSCPPLLTEPYEGQRLNEQLTERARSFVNDGRNVVLQGEMLSVSRIFKWYGDDFGDVAQYLMRYATGDLAQGMRALGPKVEVRFLDYDWSLNGK